MADELTRLRTGAGPTGAENDVVEALLEQTKQVLARRTLEAVGLFIGATELTLKNAIDVLRLLLLLQLREVFAAGIATASTTMCSRRERATIESLASLGILEDVRVETTGKSNFGACVTRHDQLLRRFA